MRGKKEKKRLGAEKNKKGYEPEDQSDAYRASNSRLDIIITIAAGQVHQPVHLRYDFTTQDDEIRRQGNKQGKKKAMIDSTRNPQYAGIYPTTDVTGQL